MDCSSVPTDCLEKNLFKKVVPENSLQALCGEQVSGRTVFDVKVCWQKIKQPQVLADLFLFLLTHDNDRAEDRCAVYTALPLIFERLVTGYSKFDAVDFSTPMEPATFARVFFTVHQLLPGFTECFKDSDAEEDVAGRTMISRFREVLDEGDNQDSIIVALNSLYADGEAQSWNPADALVIKVGRLISEFQGTFEELCSKNRGQPFASVKRLSMVDDGVGLVYSMVLSMVSPSIYVHLKLSKAYVSSTTHDVSQLVQGLLLYHQTRDDLYLKEIHEESLLKWARSSVWTYTCPRNHLFCPVQVALTILSASSNDDVASEAKKAQLKSLSNSEVFS